MHLKVYKIPVYSKESYKIQVVQRMEYEMYGNMNMNTNMNMNMKYTCVLIHFEYYRGVIYISVLLLTWLGIAKLFIYKILSLLTAYSLIIKQIIQFNCVILKLSLLHLKAIWSTVNSSICKYLTF